MSSLSSKHLLGLEDLTREDIITIMDSADYFNSLLNNEVKKLPTLKGKTILNMFYENSTRTRISFELAEKRLSADTINFSKAGSAVSKGETLIDTLKNIEAMKLDMVVIRHQSPGAAYLVTQHSDASVLNAGDGGHEHPTQGLLDMATLRSKIGELEGKHVAIVGDIIHSRVARSNIFGLLKVGAKVTVCGPSTLMPPHIERLGVNVSHNIDEVIEDVDALNILRIQLERQDGSLFPSVREYHNYFGVTRERLEKATRPITIMHPGPMNRGVEISSNVADSEHSIILDQVTYGVATRMGILYLLVGGKLENLN
jgi:aspartate carbamoyltransferase catalytic subunit